MDYEGDNNFWLDTGNLLDLFLLQEFHASLETNKSDSWYNTAIPVALHVCCEARQHTWAKYRLLSNTLHPWAKFCASPDRDVLLIQDQCGKLHNLRPNPVDYECLRSRNFKTVLLLSCTWKLLTPAQYARYYLDHLPDIETILLQLDEGDIDECSDGDGDEEAEDMEVLGFKKGNSRLSGEVARIKAEYSEVLTGYGGPAKRLLFVDHTGKCY